MKPTRMTENDLRVVARQFRRGSKTTRAEAARDLKVSYTSIFNAEENPEESLDKLRIRIIEKYSEFTVDGPVYYLKKK